MANRIGTSYNALEYVEYFHNDSSITTIDSLLRSPSSIVNTYFGKTEEFLRYDGGTGSSNAKRIFNAYTYSEQQANQAALVSFTLTMLKSGCTLIIPKDKVNKDIVAITGVNQFVKQDEVKTFLADELVRLLKDPKYKPSENLSISGDSLKEEYPTISVWMWMRSMNRIMDVSKFVENLSISVTKSGGSFNITFAAIEDIGDDITSTDIDRIVFESNLYNNQDSKNRTEFFFHSKVNCNDVVWIKLEELEIRNENRNNSEFIVPFTDIPGQVYDMIGLVDSTRISYANQGVDINIEVSGRDLIKLFTDDADYFFPLLFVQNETEFYSNPSGSPYGNNILNRNYIKEDYQYIFAKVNRSLKENIQFILNHLGNLSVVPEWLFYSYGDRITKRYQLDGAGELADIPMKGMWGIVKLAVDNLLDDRRLDDGSVSNPDGSVYDQLRKMCQEPFVEFWGDTYGDTYNIIVRQPPFSKSEIINYLYGVTNNIQDPSERLKIRREGRTTEYLEGNKNDLIIDIEERDILFEGFEFNDEGIYTWYEIQPRYMNLLGQQAALGYIPIVFLPSYADVWGNKRLQISSIYTSYQAISCEGQDKNIDYFRKSAIEDFKYLIESNQYLPFTRKGSITINGDRRIKRGTFIRHKGTGEIFYVDSVSNSFSSSPPDRTTVLQVSRGMIEEFIEGKEVEFIGHDGKLIRKKVSYFNIVDTDFIAKELNYVFIDSRNEQSNKNKMVVKKQFDADLDIFDFFMKRSQFNPKYRSNVQ